MKIMQDVWRVTNLFPATRRPRNFVREPRWRRVSWSCDLAPPLRTDMAEPGAGVLAVAARVEASEAVDGPGVGDGHRGALGLFLGAPLRRSLSAASPLPPIPPVFRLQPALALAPTADERLPLRGDKPPTRGMLRDEPRQRLSHHIRERPPLGEGDRAKRFVLLSLDCRKECYRRTKFFVSGPYASARSAGSGDAFSLHH